MSDQRPSKKQKELLSFIDGFIKGNGFGPSYREVMRALEYKSVSTVAVHVDGLIKKGYLIKRDRSARSLEVVGSVTNATPNPNEVHIKWLRHKAEIFEEAGLAEKAEQVRKVIDLLEPETKLA
ncbi:MAG: hypothetical protein WBB94_04590 [Candidatus Saccharimonadaceae bacterium]